MTTIDTQRRLFRPARIATLFLGESPSASGASFYDANSKLFTAMQKVFDADRFLLQNFKHNGFFLDNLVATPAGKLAPRERRASHLAAIPSLVKRLKAYQPKAVVVVMIAIRPMVEEAMRVAGLTCPLYAIPFPGQGNQLRFHRAMLDLIPLLPTANGTGWKEHYV